MKALKQKFGNTKLYHKFSILRHFPSYCGMAFPDTPFWAAFYVHVSRLFNAGEERKRVALKRKIIEENPPAQQIDKEKGYAYFDYKNNETIQSAIKCAQDYAADTDWSELQKTAKKPFLVTHDIDYWDKSYAPIAKLLNSHEILTPLVEYFGSVPVVGEVQLWYSPNKEASTDRSRSYHSDGLDRRHVQVFMPLETVDENNGPLTFLPADISAHIYKKLRETGEVSYRNEKLDDETVYEHCSPEDALKAVGEPGDAVMVDSTRCYHYGSRHGNRPRLLLVLQYYEPFSKKMPLWNRQAKPVNTLDIDPNIAGNVLGISHLEYSQMRANKAA